MLALTLLVASIAVADSINPSTIVPALWIVSGPPGSRVGSYVLGVFGVYVAGGLALVLGPGPRLITALHGIGGPVEHVLEATGGIVALVVAVVIWRSRHEERSGRRALRPHSRRAAFMLGAGIMVVELPTAFVYFGAITAILAAHTATIGAVSLVLAYNVLFVAPLIVILAIQRLAGSRAKQWLTSAEGRLRRSGRIALTGAAGALGTALLAVGVGGLLAT